jgi:hypothetical protein
MPCRSLLSCGDVMRHPHRHYYALKRDFSSVRASSVSRRDHIGEERDVTAKCQWNLLVSLLILEIGLTACTPADPIWD